MPPWRPEPLPWSRNPATFNSIFWASRCFDRPRLDIDSQHLRLRFDQYLLEAASDAANRQLQWLRIPLTRRCELHFPLLPSPLLSYSHPLHATQPPTSPPPSLPLPPDALSRNSCPGNSLPTANPPTHFQNQLTNPPLLNPPSSDLLRRLNPKHTSEHLNAIISLAPDLTEDLLSSVDQPLTVKRCKQTGRDYLLCDYNRDGDSYRSPWSNQFDPPLDEGGVGGVGPGGSEGAGEGAIPNERVRKMEVKANEAFDIYRELYYEGGVSSVYLWNLDDGFAGVVLVKKGASSLPYGKEYTKMLD